MDAPYSSSKAADLAAGQVEAIVAAAQAAADEIRANAEREAAEARAALDAEREKLRTDGLAEIERLRRDATAEADRVRTEASKAAEAERESARKSALELESDSRKAAAERVAGAEKAADDALADARAMSAGLRRLGETLSSHAESILRDVQAGHKRLRSDLRVAGGGESTRRAEGRSETPRSETPAPRAAGRGGARRPKPFDDIDVPDWVQD
jgi:hypothetical protein